MSKEVLRNVGIGQKNEDGKFQSFFYNLLQFLWLEWIELVIYRWYALDFTGEINKFWDFLWYFIDSFNKFFIDIDFGLA